MTRRTNYKVVEGTKENPKKILVKVGSHNNRYGRASLPMAVIGKVVEVIVPEVPIPESELGNGEKPEPITNRKPKVKEDGTVSEAVVDSGENPSAVIDAI